MATFALFITFMLTSAQPADVQIRTPHQKVKVGTLTYRRIRAGSAMRLQVNRKAGEQLTLDVIRIGKKAQKKGRAQLSVRVGRKEQKLNVRANLEESLPIPDGLFASYPVRHRVDLPFKANAVRITAIGKGEGIAVRIFTKKQKKSRLNLASIGLDKKKNKKKKQKRKKRRSLRKKQAWSKTTKHISKDQKQAVNKHKPKGQTTKQEDTSTRQEDTATKQKDTATKQKDAATKQEDTATKQKDAATKQKDTATKQKDTATKQKDTATKQKDAATKQEDTATKQGDNSNLPILVHAQIGGGGWSIGGVSPLSATFSTRALLYARGGFWERYGLGVGFDIGIQGANVDLGENRNSTWSAWMGKLRLETEALVLDSKRMHSLLGAMLPVDVEMGVLAGAGIAFGSHDIRVNNLQKTDAILGPTFRLGAFIGVGIGPGTVTLTLPLDLTVPITNSTSGRVSGFVPIEGAMLVGYRLDL